MISVEWTLEPNAEREILLPWLLDDPEPEIKERVVAYIAGLVQDPYRPHLEDRETGVFSMRAVPGTRIGLVWILDPEGHQVVLAYVG